MEALLVRIQTFRARARVIATAAVTWLTVAAVVVQAVVAEVGTDWPWAAEYGTRALVVIGTAIAIIRRVSPVARGDRGMLS